MYTYFSQLSFVKILLVFLIAQILGSALAVGWLELFPIISKYPDLGFEILRAWPSIILILWFLYDMGQKWVSLLPDFQLIRKQIRISDIASISLFNILIGLFSIYTILYSVVYFLPLENLTKLWESNGIAEETTLVGVIAAAIVAICLAPIAEEFIFRWFLFTKLQTKFSPWISMIFSSLLFSATHFSVSFITTFLFALVLCIVFYKTRNIALTILLHIINNTFVSIVQIAGILFSHSSSKDLNPSEISFQFYTIALPCLLVSLLLGYYLIQKRKLLHLDSTFM